MTKMVRSTQANVSQRATRPYTAKTTTDDDNVMFSSTEYNIYLEWQHMQCFSSQRYFKQLSAVTAHWKYKSAAAEELMIHVLEVLRTHINIEA